MKKLVLSLVFVLAYSFSFAGTTIITKNYMEDNYPITVHTSCGITGMIIAQDGDTISDIVEMALEMDEWICG